MNSEKKEFDIPIIVGIGGATRSGKSSLARDLCLELGIDFNTIIPQDKSWKAPWERPTNEFGINMEVPEAVDWERLKSWIEASLSKKEKVTLKRKHEVLDSHPQKYIFVEGFLIYSQPSIIKLLNKKIFLSISKETCFKRRMATKFTKPEIFSELIWPNYVKYNSNVCEMDDVLILNGESSQKELVQDCIKFLNGEKVQSQHQLLNDSLKDTTDVNVNSIVYRHYNKTRDTHYKSRNNTNHFKESHHHYSERKYEHHKKDYNEIVCYNCSEKGHIAVNCYKYDEQEHSSKKRKY